MSYTDATDDQSVDSKSHQGLFHSLARLVAIWILLSLFSGCTIKNYGDQQFRLQMASHGKDVMWVPTKIDMAREMLAAAAVSTKDIVYDLGSGDGVIPIEAARKYGVRAVGIEYNPDLVG
ncbi:MAG: hypothetical protein ACK5FQ_09115, partial [Betaproteobacteria bacterium]